MTAQTPLDILSSMMAARETYRANLITQGYTQVVLERYESSWSAWVHPNYIQAVNTLIAEHYNFDMEDIEEAAGHPLPEDAVLPDFWLAHPSDTRPGKEVYDTCTRD